MSREWKMTQHPTYLSTGLLLCLFLGFLVGSGVALATSAYYCAAGCGVAMAIWTGLIYFGWRE